MKNIKIKYKDQELKLPSNEATVLGTILQAFMINNYSIEKSQWNKGSVEVSDNGK